MKYFVDEEVFNVYLKDIVNVRHYHFDDFIVSKEITRYGVFIHITFSNFNKASLAESDKFLKDISHETFFIMPDDNGRSLSKSEITFAKYCERFDITDTPFYTYRYYTDYLGRLYVLGYDKNADKNADNEPASEYFPDMRRFNKISENTFDYNTFSVVCQKYDGFGSGKVFIKSLKINGRFSVDVYFDILSELESFSKNVNNDEVFCFLPVGTKNNMISFLFKTTGLYVKVDNDFCEIFKYIGG